MNSELLEIIHRELIQKTEYFFSQLDGNHDLEKINRITLNLNHYYHSIKKEKLFVWFLSLNFEKKIFWADKDNTYYSAGLSSVLEFSNFSQEKIDSIMNNIYSYCDILKKNDDGLPLRFWGGMTFYYFTKDKHSLQKGNSEWNHYPKIIFFLPKINLIKNDENLYLELYFTKEDTLNGIIKFINSINWNYSEKQYEYYNNIHLSIKNKIYLTNHNEWVDAMNSIYKIFSKFKSIEKIILSRALKLIFNKRLDPLAIFYRLTKNRPHSVRFYFQFKVNHAFMGATPERLFLRKGKKIYTEAIAGTRPRGKNKKSDLAFQNELIQSSKDRKEHKFVIQSIIDSFKKLNLKAKISDTKILTLKNVMHLYTKIISTSETSANDAKLLEAMHPTAAIGGYPSEKAIEILKQAESLERGWYASPVGWIEKESSEFDVAIRSGLVENSSLTLYGGAGIIPESETEAEWNEIENKINAFLSSVMNENK